MVSDSQRWMVLAGVLLVGWLLYRLSPVLSPFMAAALLAYLGDPLVDRIERMKVPRSWAVFIVFVVMTVSGFGLLLVMIPVLQEQFRMLFAKLPIAAAWLQNDVIPQIASITGMQLPAWDIAALQEAVKGHWEQLGGMVARVFGTLSHSGLRVVSWILYIVLTPVVTFYLLRDWDHLVARVHEMIPPRYEKRVSVLAKECDDVLAEFFRGQLLVMLALGFIYSIGLWIIGLDLAVLVGMSAGMVSFVPYLGSVVGIVLASMAALLQFNDVTHLVYVFVVFGVGQLIEGMLLSPILLGERIGLHPVAVIFAVMAGGQLFGFFGILLALPVASVIMVLLRHSRELYLGSDFYTP